VDVAWLYHQQQKQQVLVAYASWQFLTGSLSCYSVVAAAKLPGVSAFTKLAGVV
jgi:hypothetical protein